MYALAYRTPTPPGGQPQPLASERIARPGMAALLTGLGGIPSVGPADAHRNRLAGTVAVAGKRLDATHAGLRRALERLRCHTLRVGMGAVFACVLIEGRRHRMDMLMALAISIGVLIAVWVKVGTMASLLVPAGIVAWALFYAAGGKTQGLQKVIASTLSGVVWVWLATALLGAQKLWSVARVALRR